jgi:hypothetical protein
MRTTLTGGRSSGGTEESPTTRPFGSWAESSDSSLGISMPYLTSFAEAS